MEECGVSSSLFNPKAPHFFKIMLSSMIQAGKLIIPKKFVRKYGTHLSKSNAVLLRVPTGDVWEAELRTGDEGTIWLEKGWPDFLRFYSIEHGDFLVFQQRSGGTTNELDVVLFDKSATEIEYRIKARANLSPVKLEDISDENGIVPTETRDGRTFRRMTRRTTHLLNGNHSMNRDHNVPSKASTPACSDNPIIRTQPKAGIYTQEGSEKKEKSSSSSWKPTCGPLTGAEKIEALQRTESFKSLNPYFAIVMQRHYVFSPHCLNMPGRFLLKCMGQKKSGEMKVHVSGGKIWTLTYRINTHRRRVEAEAFLGWKKFVIDNDLVLGDVCIFELLRGLRSTSFKVTIFPTPRVARSRYSQFKGVASGASAVSSKLEGCSGAKSKGKEKVSSSETQRVELNKRKVAGGSELEPACIFVSEYPFFQLTITEGYVSGGNLSIPASFVRDHLINLDFKERMVRLMFGNRLWPTKLMVSSLSPPRAMFSAGFAAFIKEMTLKVGDFCTFELIHLELEEMVYRVFVSRAKEEQKD